jgi:hypothetical protein
LSYGRRIVLHCPRGYQPALEALVESFILDGVSFVAVVGEDCGRIEDLIDELVVGDGADASRYILTSSHPKQTLEQAVAFAQSQTDEYAEDVLVVEL